MSALPGFETPPQSGNVFQPDNIHPMIALFLPTGNHDVEKTVTLTNRYTNTYFCT